MADELPGETVETDKEIVLNESKESFPEGFKPCVYLDRTVKTSKDTHLEAVVWEPNAKSALDARIPWKEGDKPQDVIRQDSTFALPDMPDNYILWVSSQDNEGYYIQASEDVKQSIPPEEYDALKKKYGTEDFTVLEKISWDEAEMMPKLSQMEVIQDFEAFAASEKPGGLNKSNLEKVRWQNKRESMSKKPTYENILWEDLEGYDTGQPVYTDIAEWHDGKVENISMPKIDITTNNRNYEKLVVRVQSGPDKYNFYRFPTEAPILNEDETQKTGILQKMSDLEVKNMAKKDAKVIDAQTLRETWENYGRVDMETIGWQVRESAETAMKTEADTFEQEKLEAKRKELAALQPEAVVENLPANSVQNAVAEIPLQETGTVDTTVKAEASNLTQTEEPKQQETEITDKRTTIGRLIERVKSI